jgi:hypothetical protein
MSDARDETTQVDTDQGVPVGDSDLQADIDRASGEGGANEPSTEDFSSVAKPRWPATREKAPARPTLTSIGRAPLRPATPASVGGASSYCPGAATGDSDPTMTSFGAA